MTVRDPNRPDPADVVAAAIAQAHPAGWAAETLTPAIVSALREAECLREFIGDWPPSSDDGTIVVSTIRLVDVLDPDGSPMFYLARDPNLTYSGALGLLELAKESILATYRASLPEPS